MAKWQDDARWAVLKAAYGSDPETVPEYRIPKHRPWWAFWRKREWETVRGVSRAQLQRVQDAQFAMLQRRLARCNELYPNASPYFNLNSPLLD